MVINVQSTVINLMLIYTIELYLRLENKANVVLSKFDLEVLCGIKI